MENNKRLGKFKVTMSPPITATKLGPTETIEEFFEKSIQNMHHTSIADTHTGKKQTQHIRSFLEVSPKKRTREKTISQATA